MKLPVNLANNIFKIKVTVFDELVAYVKGRPVRTQLADRVISGTIQPVGDKDAVLFEDGQQSDGAFILHTSAEMFTCDSTQDSEEQRQTFVRYKGEIWKLTKAQNWEDHIQGSVNRYGLVKYVNLNDNE